MASLRDKILAAEDLPLEEVATDEWAPFGVPSVHLRGLSAAERDAYEQSLLTMGPGGRRIPNPNIANVRAGFVAKILVDPDTRERVFTDADIAKLGKKNAAVIDRLWESGRRLSGMAGEEEEEENPSTDGQSELESSELPSPSA